MFAASKSMRGAMRRMSTSASSDVGILAAELYIPKRYVAQSALEKADGVSSGKYTVGAYFPARSPSRLAILSITRPLAPPPPPPSYALIRLNEP